jgi:ABC-2 type transport system permease protein
LIRVCATLVRRELGGYFLALTGYVIIAGVLLLLGVSFVALLESCNGGAVVAPLTEMFYSTMYFWLILLVATPVMTMRLFAQEKFSGTFETLMTTPVTEVQVVLAKFVAALVFYVVTWLPLLACLHILRTYTSQQAVFDWWPVASTYLGILLLGSLYVAMGCFASALTRSQIIAAMISLALGLSLFVVSFLKFSVASLSGWPAQVISYLSLIDHMEDFTRGVVDTRHVAFYLTLTAWFLFLTWKVVETRRWK